MGGSAVTDPREGVSPLSRVEKAEKEHLFVERR